jgi:amino acid transporter
MVAISGKILYLIIPIIGFIIFIFKIHDKKNERKAYRNSLFMALIGIIIIVFSFSIDKNGDRSSSAIKTLLLTIGAVYTLYGGFYTLDKHDKNSNGSNGSK